MVSTQSKIDYVAPVAKWIKAELTAGRTPTWQAIEQQFAVGDDLIVKEDAESHARELFKGVVNFYRPSGRNAKVQNDHANEAFSKPLQAMIDKIDRESGFGGGRGRSAVSVDADDLAAALAL